MGIPVEVLEAELLQLPKADRIRVLDRVVASLDADAARDAAWDAIAKQRQAQAEADPSQMLVLDESMSGLSFAAIVGRPVKKAKVRTGLGKTRRPRS